MSLYIETLDITKPNIILSSERDIKGAIDNALNVFNGVNRSCTRLYNALGHNMSRYLLRQQQVFDPTLVNLIYSYLENEKYVIDDISKLTKEERKVAAVLKGLIFEEALEMTLVDCNARAIEREARMFGLTPDAVAFFDGNEEEFLVHDIEGNVFSQKLSGGLKIFEAKATERLGYVYDYKTDQTVKDESLLKKVKQAAIYGGSIVAVRLDTEIEPDICNKIYDAGGTIVKLKDEGDLRKVLNEIGTSFKECSKRANCNWNRLGQIW